MALSRTFHKTSMTISLFIKVQLLTSTGCNAHDLTRVLAVFWCFLYSFSQICSVVSYKVSLPVNMWFATIIKLRFVRSSSNRTNSEYLRCKSLTKVCLIRSSLAWKCRRKVRIPSMFRASLRMQADLRWFCQKKALWTSTNPSKKATTKYCTWLPRVQNHQRQWKPLWNLRENQRLPLPVSQRFTNRALYHGESPTCSWWISHPIPFMVPWWSFHHDSSFSIPKPTPIPGKRLKQHRAHNDGLALGKCLLTAAPGKKWHQHQKKTCTKIQANEKAQNLSKNPKKICKNIKTIHCLLRVPVYVEIFQQDLCLQLHIREGCPVCRRR